MLFAIGIPLVFMELCWGQFASLGPIAVWNMNPLFKGKPRYSTFFSAEFEHKAIGTTISQTIFNKSGKVL
jgi:hypothetical protein